MTWFRSARFIFAHINANFAAHVLAKKAAYNNVDLCLLEDIP